MVLFKTSCIFLLAVLTACFIVAQSQIAEVNINLKAPRWVSRGSSATFQCIHDVPHKLLYKVEFLRGGAKLLQYVRERIPPYVNFTISGGRINMSLTTEKSVTLENVDFAATGHYWCEVSLETPIYTAASPAQLVTVVHPQKHPPIITFKDSDVAVGEMLIANCTSAPAAPAPHLTWYINELQVNESFIHRFTHKVLSSYRSAGKRRKHYRQILENGGNISNHVRHRLAVSTTTVLPTITASSGNETQAVAVNTTRFPVECRLKDTVKEKLREPPKKHAVVHEPALLTVSVAQLRVIATGPVRLTCVSTVPAHLEPGQNFADIKKQTVTVEVGEARKSYTEKSNGKLSHANPGRQLSNHLLLFAIFILFL